MKAIYDGMWEESAARFDKGEVETDRQLYNPHDRRRGVSLIFRPHGSALDGLIKTQNRLKSVAGDQYFTEADTLHVTGLSLLSCANDFQLNDINAEHYAEVVEESLRYIPPFNIEFKGLTASPSCVLAQGFVATKALSDARGSIKRALEDAGLRHTIGKRYPLRTAHCTLLRFMVQPSRFDEILDVLTELRDEPIGGCRLSEAHLVFNDWYHRHSVVQELRRIPLKSDCKL